MNKNNVGLIILLLLGVNLFTVGLPSDLLSLSERLLIANGIFLIVGVIITVLCGVAFPRNP